MPTVFPQEFLAACAAASGVPAFEHGDRTVSRAELLESIARLAGGLRAAGFGPGAGIAVRTGVTPEGFAVRFAGHLLGCRVIAVPAGLTAAQVPHVLSGADVLIADDTAEAVVRAGAAAVLPLELLPGEPVPLHPAGNPDDPAMVLYTSGSTGVPKAVEYSYAAMSEHWAWQRHRWTADVERLAQRYGRYLLFGSLASGVMLEHLGLCLLGGGTAVIPADLSEFHRVLRQHRISATLLTVPRLYALTDTLRAEGTGLDALRSALVSGSPLPAHRLREALDVLGDAVCQGYGQTEIGMASLLTADDLALHPESAASVGRCWAGTELEIRDADGTALPAGATGEVWVRTPNAFRGYPDGVDPDVRRGDWVRTRDLGWLDENGFLYLAGRARDVVFVNAVLHYLGPIEQALAAHPDVDAAYVVAAADEHTGEAAHAFVLAVRGRVPRQDALRAAVAERLGAAAVPATITVVDSVPVGPSGKPDKHALLARLP